MSKRKKLFDKIRRNPRNVHFDDLRKLLELFGFELKRTRGSHNSFVGKVGNSSILITIPFNRPFIKPVYVEKALELIDRIIVDSEDDDGDEEND